MSLYYGGVDQHSAAISVQAVDDAGYSLPSTCDHVVSMWPVYLFAYFGGNFLYSLIFHGDSIYLIKTFPLS